MATNKNKLYCLIYRVRAQGFSVSIKERTIYYNCNDPQSVETKSIRRLCAEYGFVRQATII
ncbi:hypothetical protein [Dysgonomonas sp. 521]|uniref:hypothetical protein n=1 Tax=Dysgonomonas sp. 521 TaxID=2302932 RepID=UPI0013D28603|nr:hypothetical protein [Dysgonomonas sp. 521]